MRICNLSKSQDVNPLDSSNKLKTYPEYPYLFKLISCKGLTPSIKARRALKSRHIAREMGSLPFQATTKLFHAPP